VNYELIINSSGKGNVIALLQDKKLVELHRDNAQAKFQVGDIYLGKVGKIMPALNAVFVDVGYEKDAFLHYSDLGPSVRSLNKFLQDTLKGKQTTGKLMYFKNEPEIPKDGKITDLIKSGQSILVQIAKEPISAKGPRITCELSIPGRYLVLIPFSDKISVSSKIRTFEEKDRLRGILQNIKPKNFGVIIRTVAEGKSVEELENDLNELLQKWEECFKSIKKAQIPSRLFTDEDKTNALLRDLLNESFTAIHCDNPQLTAEIREYVKSIAPDKEKIVQQYKGVIPIFEAFGVEKQIKSLFGKTVYLKSGAYLVIEHTEALHVFDVNSGNKAKGDNTQEENALEVNMEAAVEVARQLRLRDMGGIIVVDFIDMQNPENRKVLYQKLKDEMKSDRAKHNILPPSKFGLIQITRQRLRPEINVEVLETCPSCGGSGKIQPSVLFTEQISNALRFIVKEQNEKKITLHVHPYIEAYLKKGGLFRSIQWKWFFELKRWVKIVGISSCSFMEYHFYNAEMDEIII
jgi:ribonuclease G